MPVYRVCIADDELYVRKSITQRIEKSKLPLLVVGTAENGEKGWELFNKEKPDIFLVDIKMPMQDGLGMIEKIKKEYRNVKTKFIVISGYDDFEYMQKAIQVGVVDYIRKPFESEQFIRVLEKICSQLEEEEIEESKKMTKGRMIFWRDFYKVMKHKEVSGTFLLLYQKDMLSQANVWKLEKIYPDSDWKYICFHSTNQILLLYSDRPGTPVFASHKSDALMDIARYAVLYSGRESLDQILQCLEQNLDRRFYPGTPFLIKADTIPEKHKTVWDLHELEAALKNTRENQYQVLIRKIVGELEADNENFIYYTEFFHVFNAVIASIYTSYGLNLPDDISRSFSPMALADFNRSEDLLKSVNASAEALVTKVRELTGRSEIVDNVIRYIKNHYKEDINLNVLANEFFLSPAYLSRKFSRTTGVSIMSYLEDYRINVATDLLKGSERSISEIADQVGYYDANYFTKIFKKVKGITPKEFRKMSKSC